MNADYQLRCFRVANGVAYSFLTASIECNIDVFLQRTRLAARAELHSDGGVTRNLIGKFLYSRGEAESVQNTRIKRVGKISNLVEHHTNILARGAQFFYEFGH